VDGFAPRRIVVCRTAVNAFHVIGSVLALWALTLTAIGVKREDFPRAGRQTLAVGAVSILLAASAIGSGIITTALDDHGGEATASHESEGGGQRLELSADPGGALRFDKRSLEARAGPVMLVMHNPSPVPHNISIEGGEEGDTVGEGGSSTASADLKPGSYAFYCSVPGHREGGMEGTLTVR
jgi:plastocyanin